MRALAELLYARGYWVVGLRLPGHGTAPSGLLHATWRTGQRATRLAVRHVRGKIGRRRAARPRRLLGRRGARRRAMRQRDCRGRICRGSTGWYCSRRRSASRPPRRSRGCRNRSPEAWRIRKGGVDGYPARVRSVQVQLLHRQRRRPDVPAHAAHRPSCARARQRRVGQGHAAHSRVPVGGRCDRIGAGGREHAIPPPRAPRAMQDRFLRHQPPGRIAAALRSRRARDARRAIRWPGAAVRSDRAHECRRTEQPNCRAAPARGVRPRSCARQRTWCGPTRLLAFARGAAVSTRRPVYGAGSPQSGRIHLGQPELLGERGFLAVPPTVLMRLRYDPFFHYVERRIETVSRIETGRHFCAVRDPRSRCHRRSISTSLVGPASSWSWPILAKPCLRRTPLQRSGGRE